MIPLEVALAVIAFALGLLFGLYVKIRLESTAQRLTARIRRLPTATSPALTYGDDTPSLTTWETPIDESMWDDPDPQPVDTEWLERMRNVTAREDTWDESTAPDPDPDPDPDPPTPSYAAEQLAWYEEEAAADAAARERVLTRMRRDLADDDDSLSDILDRLDIDPQRWDDPTL